MEKSQRELMTLKRNTFFKALLFLKVPRTGALTPTINTHASKILFDFC